MTKTERNKLYSILAEFGCSGPCSHGSCYEEQTCEECSLFDVDSWCLACRIAHVMNVEIN